MPPNETIDQEWTRRGASGDGASIPGLVLLFTGSRSALSAIPLVDGRAELGRGMIGGIHVDDPCMSRKHAEVSFDQSGWHLRDLGSRNGSALEGVPFTGAIDRPDARILRVGDTLLLLAKDVRPFQLHSSPATRDRVAGPTLSAAWAQIERASIAGDTLHLVGETGSGKEIAAQIFHHAGRSARGRLVAVNCAAIPHALAERLLFGARRGAYSGADADVPGYLQEADGGTLFLDEIGELDLAVQAKLLRALETREVMALGASRPEKIDIRMCSATHKSLRNEVSAGRFRSDLFFRIGVPEVVLPPLRERPEDIAPLVELELSRIDGSLAPHVSLIEACLVRPWPGNVRELFVAVRTAAREAAAAARKSVEARDLGARDGQGFEDAPAERSPASDASPPAGAALVPRDLSKEEIEAVLARVGGNVSRAARELGLHRTQLRRRLAELGLDTKLFRE